ncbi:MAG: Hsp20 family protein [Alphaproteobacteria bacterium]|nr:Hsp20 family protein [Alphaproteobacteria bacterium]
MTRYDFSPLFRSSIGFDRLFDLADSISRMDQAGPSYPPYDIQVGDENKYRITMAVAGFSEDELDIELRENTLTIAGKKKDENDESSYLHRGVAGRDFVRKFELADHMKVTGAHLSNGVLSVDLVREVPEAKKPKHIEIKAGEPESLPKKAKKLLENVTKKSA